MSSSTWTPHAVSPNTPQSTVRLWRAVEAQHVASTRRVVDSLEEQRVLEDILEASKPAVPPAAAKLHYLLFTPFRYPSPQPSRFRGTHDPGIFYGAENVRTACAELGYWRWRFVNDSAGLAMLGPAPQTLFQVSVRTTTVDLERKPLVQNAALWRDPNDYTATQSFARAARDAQIGLIQYASVRDPEPGRCGAVLRPDAFSCRKPIGASQTWLLTVTRRFAVWHRDVDAFEFDMQRWQR